MSFRLPERVHIIGIGGINTSGVAKLLLQHGVAVSGSDVQASPFTKELIKWGADVAIGHAAENVPDRTELVIYSSAVPSDNPERAEARRRNIKQQNSFQFLGEWSEDQHAILVCGTHGKSTTTALLGLMLKEGGLDPTVIVGTKVPAFKEGNVSLGSSDLVVIEGDEYARHFLEFHPSAVILNNVELDHTDVFPTIEDLMQAFRELLTRVRSNGVVAANADDARVQTLIGEERARLEARGVRIMTFGFGSHADMQIMDPIVRDGMQIFALRDEQGLVSRFSLHIPGRMNVMNATAAVTLALQLHVDVEAIRRVFASFRGVWRRFEILGERDGMLAISDYGHHPTAVQATLDAAKLFYPGRRLVLCFQPHHRNRTKHLFLDFVPAFDKADVLLLAEIYDVAGRDTADDQDISSRDLQDAVMRHDADRGIKRPVDFAPDPESALDTLKRWRKPGDVIIVMGAGDIDRIASRVLDR